MPQFGKEFRKQHFSQLPDHVVPVNNGSYGLPPKAIIDRFHAAFDEDVAFPDGFLRVRQPVHYKEAVRRVAPILHTAPENLALLENATTGLNAVFNSLNLRKGDIVALPVTTYGACQKIVQFYHDYRGVELQLVEVAYPVSDAELVAKFRKVFETHKVKVALFDTVVSMPGVKVPWEQLVALCKNFGVISVVDAAHGIGLVPLDLDKAKPDFLCTNLHKWFYVPRGCALLYVDPQYHRTIQSLPVAESYVAPDAELPGDDENNILYRKFLWTGSRNFAPLMCVSAAIKFREETCGGDEAILNYCYKLAREAGEVVKSKWPGAQIVENEEGTLSNAMLSFFVPIEEYSNTFDATDRDALARLVTFNSDWQLAHKHTFIPIAGHAGKIVARVSANVFNELDDYRYACDALDGALKAFFQ
ncbi:hypothetical protein FDK38_001086 [Candidozyma auris]|nr:hypothetical protein FDK38_001086 [[Candida] auris]